MGDGSFQVTARELSTILRHDHGPVIFLINNGGYTIEHGYLGKPETYNDIAKWSYADLPKIFRRDTSARSFVVKTGRDLQDAVSAPNDTMVFIESIVDPYDALAPAAARGPTSTMDPAACNIGRTCSCAQTPTVDPHRFPDNGVARIFGAPPCLDRYQWCCWLQRLSSATLPTLLVSSEAYTDSETRW